MFINSRRSYTRDGEQRAEGRFLMVFGHMDHKRELRALVRHVKMRQCGHWMMAKVKVQSDAAKAENDTVGAHDKANYPEHYRVADGHYRISLSGTYGGDGLPISAEAYPGLWEQLHPLPEELVEKFWNGGGHNSSGSEGPDMHEWAKENAQELSRLRKVSATDARAEKMESALRLVLAIADHPEANPKEVVKLSPASRRQIERALATGDEPESESLSEYARRHGY